MEFKPIAVYDIEPEQDDTQQEKVFFDETLGLLWLNLNGCAEFNIVKEDGNNVILLDWNKVNCDWVGFGNSWSSFVSDDISMTFYVMNDYTIREYFEEWQNRVVNQNTFEIGYNNEYTRDVTIAQLKRGTALELPIDKFFGLNVDIDTRSADSKVYECKLLGAYPTTMNQIELNNELDGLVQLNIQLSYRNWKKI